MGDYKRALNTLHLFGQTDLNLFRHGLLLILNTELQKFFSKPYTGPCFTRRGIYLEGLTLPASTPGYQQ